MDSKIADYQTNWFRYEQRPDIGESRFYQRRLKEENMEDNKTEGNISSEKRDKYHKKEHRILDCKILVRRLV
jgi:hypothetical protein